MGVAREEELGLFETIAIRACHELEQSKQYIELNPSAFANRKLSLYDWICHPLSYTCPRAIREESARHR